MVKKNGERRESQLKAKSIDQNNGKGDHGIHGKIKG